MATNKQILDAILALTAALTAKAEPVAPAQAASTEAPAPTFATKAMREHGEGFACTATLADGQAPCSRVLRTAKRAASHGVDAGHEYRA
jgi:hypothetical protein